MKIKGVRLITGFSLMVVFSLILGACGANVPTNVPKSDSGTTVEAPQPTQAISGEKIKLVVWVHAADQFTKAQADLVNLYKTKNPNVEIEIQSFPWGDFPAKLVSSMASGVGPDVIQAYSPWMMSYIRTGKVEAVPDSFASADAIRQKYYESSLALLDYNGKYYGIPANVSLDQTRVLLVDDNLVNAAGVNLDDNQTFDDFTKDWQALTVVDSSGTMTRAGLGMVCAEPPYQFTSYLMEYGGSILSEDGRKAALNSEAGHKAFQIMIDLVKKYKVDSALLTDFSCIGNGTAATSYRGTWFVSPILTDYPDFKWHFIKMPLPTGATTELFNGGSGWAEYVPSNSAHKDAAWDYIKFMDENREGWLAATYEVAASKELAAKQAKENPQLYGVYYPILEQSKHGWPYGDYFAIYDTLSAMFTSVVLDKATIDEALATAETTINKHLDEWWKQVENK